MSARLDHLVVAARTLAEGRAWLESHLGCAMQEGGQHTMFGTHNALLSLGPHAYLEVIAIDPEAKPLNRPRWFELDTPAMQGRLAKRPVLIHWVAQVEDKEIIPDPLEISRGEYHWCLSVSEDGHLPMQGAAPSLIYWQSDSPAQQLPDQKLCLKKLKIQTPQKRALQVLLEQIGYVEPVHLVEDTHVKLSAVIQTPWGMVEL